MILISDWRHQKVIPVFLIAGEPAKKNLSRKVIISQVSGVTEKLHLT
jgi:hypothetical protein